METLNSAMKNQLSFNKMLETQIAQLAAALPHPTAGKLPGQPEAPPKEHINAVTTRVESPHRTPHLLVMQVKRRRRLPSQKTRLEMKIHLARRKNQHRNIYPMSSMT